MTLHRLPPDPRPEQLPEGTEVVVTHPEFPTEFTSGSPGRRCQVLHTSWHNPAPTKFQPKPDPPRLFVRVREPRLLNVIQSLNTNGGDNSELDWDREYILAYGSPGYGCGMLQADKRCGVYPSRPNVCVYFEAGGEKCQELRERAGLEPLQSIGRNPA